MSFRYLRWKIKLFLCGTHAGSFVRTQWIRLLILFFVSIFPLFFGLAFALPWFISSTPVAELDRIIIGSRNLLMNLRRLHCAASSHVRSSNAIDPKSQSDATFLYAPIDCNTIYFEQSQPKNDMIIIHNEIYERMCNKSKLST